MKEVAEKLARYGKDHLSIGELVTLITGNKEASDKVITDARYKYNVLLRYSNEDLRHYGFTTMQASRLVAGLEIFRRASNETYELPRIKSSQDVYQYMYSRLAGLNHEEVYCIFLNRNNKILKTERISTGGVNASIVDVKLIMRQALAISACALLMVHNHPSVNTEPSEADKEITDKVKQAAAYFEINLLDHVIYTDNGYYSFADNGEI